MSDIAVLLSDVHFRLSTVKQARNRFAKDLAPDFRIFDYLRRDETGISKCIADLLDPHGAHAQGGIFLGEFLKLIGHNAPWKIVGGKNPVEVEKQIEKERRIDIFIELDNIVVGIENKPWAADQKDQLSDYADYLRKTARNKKWMLIYLCNWEPSSHSIKEEKRIAIEDSGNFLKLDFHQLVLWLNACAEKSRPLAVRIFIEQLGKFVRGNIIGEAEMSDQIEIQQAILATDASLASAFHIAREMRGIQEKLLGELLAQLSEKIAPDNMILESNFYRWGRCEGFAIVFWQGQRIKLRFEFDKTNLNGFGWGLQRIDEQYKSEETWTAILDLMNANFGNGSSYPWWPWYSYVPDKYFGSGFGDWSISETPWLMMRSKQLVIDIANLALAVRKAFEGQEHLLK